MKGSWVTATLSLNWANMTANKSAFWSLAFFMCLQNLIYFTLWMAFFSRIHSLNGWGLREVAFLFGAGALGYGVVFTVFGGINQIAVTIRSGNLDIFLSRPRALLPMLTMQRMRADSLGDVMTGLAMIIFFVRPAWSDLPLLFVLIISSGLVYVAVRLILQSLAFWSVSDEAGEGMYMAFIIATTNPQVGFGGWGRAVLLSVFPAGYVALLPVEILHHFSWLLLLWQTGASLGLMLFASYVFSRGLKRYASGNQMLTLR